MYMYVGTSKVIISVPEENASKYSTLSTQPQDA